MDLHDKANPLNPALLAPSRSSLYQSAAHAGRENHSQNGNSPACARGENNINLLTITKQARYKKMFHVEQFFEDELKVQLRPVAGRID